MNIMPQEHWVKIVVFGGPTPNYDKIECLLWEGMLFPIRTKYDWYFKYRAALLQVKYPKYTVQFTWGSCELSNKSAESLLRNKIIAKKRKITECENKLQIAREQHHKLFPIEEDVLYQNTVRKIERLKFQLQELENKSLNS